MSFPTFQVAKGLYRICPGARFKGIFENNTQQEYEMLEWHDIRVKPAWSEIEQASLTILRADIKQNMNQRTSDIITYEFKSNLFPSNTFHMELEWQFQIQNVWLCRDTLITFPYDIYCSSDEDGNCEYVTIESKEIMHQFYLEGFLHVDNTLKSGRAEKKKLVSMSRTMLEEYRDLR